MKIATMEWPVYFQNPRFLEASRQFLIPEDMREMIRKRCHIKAGMKVLEVGCGTGYYTRFLAHGCKGTEWTGLDREAVFIKEAKKILLDASIPQNIIFVLGDALSLPFEDSCFDAVISHTFFTSIDDPAAAISEMKRVCKSGGHISSVTSMSLLPQVSHPGTYPPYCSWYTRLLRLEEKVWRMYEAVNPLSNYTNSLPTAKIPRFFSDSGLLDVSIFPIGKAFSLSDASLPADGKREYIINMCEARATKIDNHMELERRRYYLSDEECDEYIALLGEERDFLLSILENNRIWQWEGGANLLVSGRNEK